ncbi:hypothetical protein [Ramlibacter sp.]|uniref:hypothetical protein n=1 Tax=Ramlibacter sp. TaxID=1917967 RepID=UPI001799D813|nr:hypothetical protein [Ramlibacter sp.]MBA2673458.1 hypothetical protein [Ramlibacter sp.]
MTAKNLPAAPSPSTGEPLDLATSAAGEEDPGAAIDMAPSASPGASDQPAGAPGSGENVCPSCGGTGTFQGMGCPECEGTGKVTVGIGGA